MSTAAPESGHHSSESITSPSSSSAVPRRKDVVAKEKEEYGGIKVGSAFFGWLTATGGIAVWLWAIAVAIVAAVLVAIGGSDFNVLATLNSFPRIPVDEGAVSTGGLIALVAVALASLVGAMLGGLAGMRFHRNVDKAGLGH